MGVIAYECLTGQLPFKTESKSEFFQSETTIKAICDKLELLTCSEEAKDFLFDIFKVNPSERLGATNIDNLLGHKWLIDFNTPALTTWCLEAPFKPSQNKDNFNYAEFEQEWDDIPQAKYLQI